MTDVHSSPDPTDDPERRGLAAWLFGRGAWGTTLWFALLAALLITLVLIANECSGDDDDDDAQVVAVEPTPTAEPTPTPEPVATPEPEPVATATPEPEPTATPEPTAAPLAPLDVTMEVAGGGITLTGTVPDQATADQMESVATNLVGIGNVTNNLVIDPETTADGGTVRLIGETDDGFATSLVAAITGALPDGTSLDESGLSVVATTDIVAELNALFAANPVQFATGSADILPESQAVLDEVGAKLNEFPAVALSIEGHTDNTGDPESNLQLSLARAQAVEANLVAQGVSDDRLDTVGKGAAEPIADNDTEEGRQENRRIEFSIAAS